MSLIRFSKARSGVLAPSRGACAAPQARGRSAAHHARSATANETAARAFAPIDEPLRQVAPEPWEATHLLLVGLGRPGPFSKCHIAGMIGHKNPMGVRFGSDAGDASMSAARLLHPAQRTNAKASSTSAMGQKRNSAAMPAPCRRSSPAFASAASSLGGRNGTCSRSVLAPNSPGVPAPPARRDPRAPIP